MTRQGDLNGQRQVPIDELLTESFLSKHCRFPSFEGLVRNSGFSQGSGAISKEEFKVIPGEKWNEWISKVTDFPDWSSLIDAAAREYISSRMFEGL